MEDSSQNNTADSREGQQETAALLVDPVTRTVRAVTIKGYDGIKAILGAESEPEGATLCRIQNGIYLQGWVDCKRYLTAPAFVTSCSPKQPIHGLTVIDAYDISTGETVDCPFSQEAFLKIIEWEDAGAQSNPARPNPDWIQRFQIKDSNADVVIQYGS